MPLRRCAYRRTAPVTVAPDDVGGGVADGNGRGTAGGGSVSEFGGEDAPEQQPARRGWAGLALVDRFLIPILTALLAVGATYVGANLANEGALTTQREQIAEDRAAADRERRAETYVTFLAKATTYSGTVAPVASCLDRGLLAEPLIATGIPDDDPRLRCAVRVADFGMARNEFQNARNAVFLYGSQPAEDAAGQLAGALPPAVGSYVPEDARRFAPDRFAALYSDFNRVVCEDVQTDPDRRC